MTYISSLFHRGFRPSVIDVILFSWTAILILQRPSVFGEFSTELLLILQLTVSVLYNVYVSKGIKLKTDYPALLVNSSWIFFSLYLFLQGIVLSTAKDVVTKSTLISVVIFISILLVLDSKSQPRILRFFVNFNFLLSCTGIVTFVILILAGFDYHKIPILGVFETYGRFNDGTKLLHHRVLFFPLTLTWSAINIGHISIPRFIGIYKEPGIAQIFFATSFFITFFIRTSYTRIKQVFLLAATFLTFSTAGLVSIFIGFLVLFYKRLKLRAIYRTFRSPLKVIFVLMVLYFAGQIVYSNIVDEFSTFSGISRLQSFERGISNLIEKPLFGWGYYYGFQVDEVSGKLQSEATNGLLGVSFQLGIFGLFLYFLAVYFGLLTFGRKETLAIYVPYFVTIATSQPAFNVPLTAFLILINTSQLSRSNERKLE